MVNIQNIEKVYNEGLSNRFKALNNLNLTIQQGEFIAIMGESGSGKSTLLNLMAGFDNPTKGRIEINGIEISKMKENNRAIFRRKNIGFVFQSFNLLPDLNVLENIMMPLLVQGKKIEHAKSMAREYVNKVGLNTQSKNKPEELSGGQKQRVAVARAVITSPKILLADEPTGNLDSKNSKEILELLVKLNIEKGQTIIMVTHSESAAGYSSRLIQLRDGEVINDSCVQGSL